MKLAELRSTTNDSKTDPTTEPTVSLGSRRSEDSPIVLLYLSQALKRHGWQDGDGLDLGQKHEIGFNSRQPNLSGPQISPREHFALFGRISEFCRIRSWGPRMVDLHRLACFVIELDDTVSSHRPDSYE